MSKNVIDTIKSTSLSGLFRVNLNKYIFACVTPMNNFKRCQGTLTTGIVFLSPRQSFVWTRWDFTILINCKAYLDEILHERDDTTPLTSASPSAYLHLSLPFPGPTSAVSVPTRRYKKYPTD